MLTLLEQFALSILWPDSYMLEKKDEGKLSYISAKILNNVCFMQFFFCN